ncbi:MAG: response regulator [Candidatus Hydrogenedentota bacterium]
MAKMKQSFSTSEVAKYCHVTPDTIRKWAEAGRIHVFKTPGGHRRIRHEDLIQFLHENKIPVHADLRDAGTKILVADEEKSVISVIQRFLERSHNSFQVTVAMDGFDAGQQMALFRPDVLFMDLHMPGFSGASIVTRIKGNPEYANSQVIALVDSEDRQLGEAAVESGAALCLRKPFTPDDLRRALAKVGVEVN